MSKDNCALVLNEVTRLEDTQGKASIFTHSQYRQWMEVSCVIRNPAALIPAESDVISCLRDCLGTTSILGAVNDGKISVMSEIEYQFPVGQTIA
jgi:hypothetical protein